MDKQVVMSLIDTGIVPNSGPVWISHNGNIEELRLGRQARLFDRLPTTSFIELMREENKLIHSHI